MSLPMIKTVRAAIASDKQLTAVDKLILLEFAWNAPEHGAPRVIRYKTYARALGLCPKHIRSRVRIMIARGYFEPVGVIAAAGSKLKGGVLHPPVEKSGGGSHTPRGGVSHPPKRGSHTPPLKEKEKKKGPPALSNFQKSQILASKSVLIGSDVLSPSDPKHVSLRAQLRERA